MFPGLDEIMKKVGESKGDLDKNHKETKAVLEEIRELLREIAKALKGE